MTPDRVAVQVWPEAGVMTASGAYEMDEMTKAVLEKIREAIDLQNQIDALRARQLPALQQAAMILEGMDPGGGKPEVTIYSQRDLKWASERLGTSASTIGGYGCLITAAASMLTDAGKPFTPGLLNAWLIQNGGYSDGNKFVFAAPNKLKVVELTTLVLDCWNTAAPMLVIDKTLAAGGFALVKVDFDPDPDRDEHWVRYLGEGQMMDPWVGDIAPITRYKGKDATECIRGVALYKRV